MLFGHRIGRGMYCFATTEGYGDEGDADWSRNADAGTNLDLTFNARLARFVSDRSTKPGTLVAKPEAYHCRGDARITYEEVAVGRAGYSHRGGHCEKMTACAPP